MPWIEEYSNVYMRKVIDLRRQGRIPLEYGFSTPECHAIVMQVCESELVWRKNEKGEDEFLLAKLDDFNTGLIVYAGRHGLHNKWVEEDRKIEKECLREMLGKPRAWLKERREKKAKEKAKAADATEAEREAKREAVVDIGGEREKNALAKRKAEMLREKRVMETEYGQMASLWIERFLVERIGETWVKA